MLGIYFSGTGNSRYALEVFLRKYDETAEILALEDERVVSYIESNEEIVFAYSVQYSNIPKMVQDFVGKNWSVWKDKKIYIIATMGLFSGDGAGILARRLQKYGAKITGGLHLKMPDSVADVKALKRPIEKNRELMRIAEQKIDRAVKDMKHGKPTQDGIGFWSHMAGLFGQRLYFYHKTKHYTDKVKIDREKCVGCGKCAKACPMKNLSMAHDFAVAQEKCTMCYRCINMCPKQAITLLGKKVVDQGTVEKYL